MIYLGVVLFEKARKRESDLRGAGDWDCGPSGIKIRPDLAHLSKRFYFCHPPLKKSSFQPNSLGKIALIAPDCQNETPARE